MPRRKNEPPSVPKNSVQMEYKVRLPAGTNTTWYESASPEEAAEALTLGATLYTTVKNMKAGEAVAALEAKQAAELAAVRGAAEERLAAVQKELEAAAAERNSAAQRAQALFETQRAEMAAASAAEKEHLQATHTARIQEIQADLRVAQERCAALEERRRTLETGRDADIRVAEDRTKALLQHALDEKQRAIDRADTMIAGLRADALAQTEQLRELSDLIRKKPTANSRNKGTDYENSFRDQLVAVFGLGDRFSLTDSARSGIGHAADYLMNWGDHTIMWEVKNYDRAVPTAEVEKFRRDMKENPQVRVGVMVSRCTAITGQNAGGDRAIEVVEGKLHIYLSNFESMSEDSLANLLLLFRVWWAQDHSDAAEEDETKIAAIRAIEKLFEEAAKAKTEWRLHKSHMDSAMRWIAERVEETESRLRGALNLLQGTAKVVEVPTGLFRDAGGDIKTTADIQTILRHTTADSSAWVKLNDLADVFGKERNMSRDTAKSHICAVLLDSQIDAHPGRFTRVLGLRLQAEAGLQLV